MPEIWYRLLVRALVTVYYRRVRVVGAVPRGSGPVLYVGLHRNGAIDGMVYKRVIPNATFLISAQLTRSFFSRLFFAGIPVTRDKDSTNDAGPRQARREMNAASLDRCVDHLIGGHSLFILPEGTSDLGPRHLPFKPGVAHILSRALARGVPVRVVPTGIFYETADAFRSDVTVVIGPDIRTDGLDGVDDRARVDELMARISFSLEIIGVNVDTADDLHRVETLAAMAEPGAGAAYYRRLKAIEGVAMPETVHEPWRAISDAVRTRRVATDRDIPVLSRRGVVWNALWLAIQAPVVASGALLNLPVVIGSWAAGRRFADARNTITLWRVLAGAPLAFIWLLTVAAVSVVLRRPMIAGVWVASTLGALWLYPELRARWPRFQNARADRAYRDGFGAVLQWVDSIASARGLEIDDAPSSIDGPQLHEVAFAALSVAAMVCLVAVPIRHDPILLVAWSAILVAIGVGTRVTHWWSGSDAWRTRFGLYLILMNVAYWLLGPTARAIGGPLHDAGLQSIDTRMFGRPLPLFFDNWTTPAVSDVLSACYFLLFPYIVFSVVRQLWRLPTSFDVAKRFHVGLYTIYGIGFLGYLFVPAQGAYLSMPEAFRHPIAGGWMTRFNDEVVRQGSSRVDVYPSLHVAVSTFILLFDRRYARWRYRLYLVPAIGLWIATLYLRYHYGIDVISGFALAAVGLWIALGSRPVETPGGVNTATSIV